MFRMIRTFHSVGQGAFYSEVFKIGKEKINVVYDCGTLSKSSKKIIEREIETKFYKGEEIHALFISHFHSDHINGIQYLIKYCNVKKIYFPLLSEENIIFIRARLYIENNKDKFIDEFIENPKQAIRNILGENEEIPELIAVIEVEEQENIEDNKYYDKVIKSGENVFIGISKNLNCNKWIYIPYNFKQKDRVDELKKQLNTQLPKNNILNGDFYNLLEDIKKDKEYFKKVQKAYENIPGGFNSNSMTLFSGPGSYFNELFNYNYFIRSCYLECYINFPFRFHQKENIGCLYTGDYDAHKDKEFNGLKKKYSNYWSSIGCVQIPHHGSKNNHNIKLIEEGKFYIVSAGCNNNYGHPSPKVIKDIFLEGGLPFIVTEKTSSRIVFFIYDRL